MNYCQDCTNDKPCPVINKQECPIAKMWDGYHAKVAEMERMGITERNPSTHWPDGELETYSQEYLVPLFMEHEGEILNLEDIQSLLMKRGAFTPITTLYQALIWINYHFACIIESYNGEEKVWSWI
jgi:hypothetical protein